MRQDTKYLKQRNNVWYFQRRIPKALQHLYPSKVMLEESLGTGDLRIARAKRDVLLGNMRQMELDEAACQDENQRFRMYHSQLSAIAEEHAKSAKGSDEEVSDAGWTYAAHPETVNKVDDDAYIEAYRLITSGRKTSDKYTPTLKDALRQFTKHAESIGEPTAGTLKRFNNTAILFLDYIGGNDIRLKDIERSVVFNFLDALSSETAPATIKGHLSRLKTIWCFALDRGLVDKANPFEKHKIPKYKATEKKKPFTNEELKKLLALSEDQDPQFKLLVYFGLYTGARISEVVGIKLKDFNEEDGILTVTLASDGGKTNAATRTIPVPEQCKSMLEAVRNESEEAGSEWLFSRLVANRKDGRYAYRITVEFGKLKQEHITTDTAKGFHSFRVMAATFAQRAGILEHEAAYLLGHSRKGDTMSYGYYSKGYTMEHIKQAQEKLCAYIDANIIAVGV